jgi:hypothetical protein
LTADSLQFSTSGETPTATSILLAGSASIGSGAAFGQGVRCVGGMLLRLYAVVASSGAIIVPTGTAPSVSARHAALGDPLIAGSVRFYMAYYRDPHVLGGCSPGSTFNATNAVGLQWAP